MHLTATPRREVAQTLASTTSKCGLNREVCAALLRVRTGPESPEDSLSLANSEIATKTVGSPERGKKKQSER